MDKYDRFPMAPSREPNPLRPYYIPPSVGPAAGAVPSPSQGATTARPPRSSSSLGSGASDLLPDLDLDFKSSAGEAWANTRALFDSLAWRYASTLMAQPFDVAKTVLQVSSPPPPHPATTPRKRRASPRQTSHYSDGSRRRNERAYESYSETSDAEDDGMEKSEDDDIPDYFSSTAPRSRSPRKRRRTPPSLSPSPDPTPTQSRSSRQRHGESDGEYQLRLKRLDSVTHAMQRLYNSSGALGLWRATNCTFLYAILTKSTESFIRSLLLAVMGLPELVGRDVGPGLSIYSAAGTSGIDLSDSPNPIGSLAVMALSGCLTGLLLAPLDLVRTRLIVASTSEQPRGVLSNIRCLPSLLAPGSLWIPTTLFHTIPQVLSASMPLFLRQKLQITPETSSGLWSLAAFCTTLTELFVRLPLETIVRRAQVQTIRCQEPDLAMIVEPAPYAGIAGTVYSIIYSEGETRTKDAKGMVRVRKGQGVAGLVRGWRIGFWGLVGVWGAGALGSGNEGRRGEF